MSSANVAQLSANMQYAFMSADPASTLAKVSEWTTHLPSPDTPWMAYRLRKARMDIRRRDLKALVRCLGAAMQQHGAPPANESGQVGAIMWGSGWAGDSTGRALDAELRRRAMGQLGYASAVDLGARLQDSRMVQRGAGGLWDRLGPEFQAHFQLELDAAEQAAAF